MDQTVSVYTQTHLQTRAPPPDRVPHNPFYQVWLTQCDSLCNGITSTRHSDGLLAGSSTHRATPHVSGNTNGHRCMQPVARSSTVRRSGDPLQLDSDVDRLISCPRLGWQLVGYVVPIVSSSVLVQPTASANSNTTALVSGQTPKLQ